MANLELDKATNTAFTTLSSNMASSSSTSTYLQHRSILDLPGEIRNLIYRHLLPERLIWYKNSRFLETWVPISFMLSCRQVYHELSGLLYDLPGFQVLVNGGTYITFLGHQLKRETIAANNFPQLQRMRELNVVVVVDDALSICASEDLLFDFFSCMKAEHQLKKITLELRRSRYHSQDLVTRYLHLRGVLVSFAKCTGVVSGSDADPSIQSVELVSTSLTSSFYTVPNAYDGNGNCLLEVGFPIFGEGYAIVQQVREAQLDTQQAIATDRRVYARYCRLLLRIKSCKNNESFCFFDSTACREIISARAHGDSILFGFYHRRLSRWLIRRAKDLEMLGVEVDMGEIQELVMELEKALPSTNASLESGGGGEAPLVLNDGAN